MHDANSKSIPNDTDYYQHYYIYEHKIHSERVKAAVESFKC